MHFMHKLSINWGYLFTSPLLEWHSGIQVHVGMLERSIVCSHTHVQNM